MTESPPLPSLGVWELAWPSMALFGLHSLVGVVDFLFVSTLGETAIAGVGVATQLHFGVFALMSAVTTGAVALVARRTGAGERLEVARVLRASVALAAGLALVMTGAIPLAEPILQAMGMAPDVASLGGACLRILLAFNLPFAVGVTISMGLRGAGDVRTPLVIGIGANLVNIVADWALIFGHLGAPELGAVGSAVATGIAFTLGGLVSWWLWERGRLVIPPVPWRGTLSLDRCRRLLRIGVPTALEQIAFQLGLLLFLGLVAGFGTASVSAYMIGVRILSFCFVPGLGFATAASTAVGQYLGAGRPDLASRLGWRANAGAMALMGTVGLAIVLFARPLAGSFGAVGEGTISLTVIFIHILGAAQPLMAVEFTLGGALRGAGDTRFPLFVILTGLFAVRLGGALLIAGPFFGTVTAVWCCLLADYAIKALMLARRFAAGRWKHVEV